MVKLAEATFLGAFAAEVAPDLGNAEWKTNITFVFNNVASERNGVVEAESFGGSVSGFVGFDDAINLFLGIATGFSKKNFVAVDGWSFDMLETVTMIYPANFSFNLIKNGLRGR